MDIMILQKTEILDPKFDEEIWNIYSIAPPSPNLFKCSERISKHHRWIRGPFGLFHGRWLSHGIGLKVDGAPEGADRLELELEI